MVRLIGGSVHRLAAKRRVCGRQGRCSRIRSPGLQRGRELPQCSPRLSLAQDRGDGACCARREGSAVHPASERPDALRDRDGICRAAAFSRRGRCIGCGMDDAWDGGYAQLRMRSENSAPVAAIPPRGSCFSDADGKSASIREENGQTNAVRRGGRHSADCARGAPWGGRFSERAAGR